MAGGAIIRASWPPPTTPTTGNPTAATLTRPPRSGPAGAPIWGRSAGPLPVDRSCGRHRGHCFVAAVAAAARPVQEQELVATACRLTCCAAGQEQDLVVTRAAAGAIGFGHKAVRSRTGPRCLARRWARGSCVLHPGELTRGSVPGWACSTPDRRPALARVVGCGRGWAGCGATSSRRSTWPSRTGARSTTSITHWSSVRVHQTRHASSEPCIRPAASPGSACPGRGRDGLRVLEPTVAPVRCSQPPSSSGW